MELVLTSSAALLIGAAGVFLLWGMVLGVFKYAGMMKSERREAPVYLDIAHRAALMYSFALLVLAALAQFSVWSEPVNLAASWINLLFFASATLSYMVHGMLNDTSNQFVKPHKVGKLPVPAFLLHGFMVALILGELGGVLILLTGFVFSVS